MSTETDLAELAGLTAMAEAIKARSEELKARIIRGMAHADVRRTETDISGILIRATVVEAERVVIDEDGLLSDLRKHVPDVLPSITKESIDRAALEGAVVAGLIPQELITDNSEVVKNKPFLKVTGKLPKPSQIPGQVIDAPQPRRVRAKVLANRPKP